MFERMTISRDFAFPNVGGQIAEVNLRSHGVDPVFQQSLVRYTIHSCGMPWDDTTQQLRPEGIGDSRQPSFQVSTPVMVAKPIWHSIALGCDGPDANSAVFQSRTDPWVSCQGVPHFETSCFKMPKVPI